MPSAGRSHRRGRGPSAHGDGSGLRASRPARARPRGSTGTTVAAETSGNITRPPNRSVSAPTGIRPSEPTTTGTATSSDCWNAVRWRGSFKRGPSGLSSAQAQKLTAHSHRDQRRHQPRPAGHGHGRCRCRCLVLFPRRLEHVRPVPSCSRWRGPGDPPGPQAARPRGARRWPTATIRRTSPRRVGRPAPSGPAVPVSRSAGSPGPVRGRPRAPAGTAGAGQRPYGPNDAPAGEGSMD